MQITKKIIIQLQSELKIDLFTQNIYYVYCSKKEILQFFFSKLVTSCIYANIMRI